MTIREEMECLERTYMSPYATLSENSRGRDREEPGMRYSSGFSA